jgi:hypothetical protein
MVPTSEMRVEVSIRDPPLISAVSFCPALCLPLRPSLLMASLFPLLRLFHVRPLLRLLHLAIVLRLLRMPISTLRFLIATVIVAMIFGPSLFRPILRLRSLLPIILVLVLFMLVLRDGHRHRSQQQRSANPTHD